MMLQAFNRAAFAKALSIAGEPFTLDGDATTTRGQKRHGILNEITAKEKLMAGGFDADVSATLEFALEVFAPKLHNGEKLTIRGKQFRITGISADEVAYQLTLEDIY